MSLLEVGQYLYRAWRYRFRVERQEIAFVLEHLGPGQSAIDIGAHKGAFTYWMQKRVGATGRVFSFEPQPELATYLARVNTTLGWNHVVIENRALSSRPGTMPLFRPSGRPTPGATLETGLHAAADRLEVPVDTLDAYFSGGAARNARPVHFIKCDVEGHELAVFQGAETILREDQPILLFECERRHHQGRPIDNVFAYLRQLGYRGTFFRQGALHPLEEFRPGYQQRPGSPDYVYNFAFAVPRNSAGRLVA